jgi:hypothetical protein
MSVMVKTNHFEGRQHFGRFLSKTALIEKKNNKKNKNKNKLIKIK